MADTIVEQKSTEASPPPLRRKPRRRGARILTAIVLVIILAIGGYLLWKYLSSYESTDDAQIDGHVNAISARISGHLSEVPVEDAQIVKAGDVLVKIDPRDYEVAVSQAQANLADAEASLQSARTDLPIVSTNTESALQTARSSRADASAGLLGAERQFEAAEARLQTAQAQVNEAQANYKKAADDAARYKQLVDKDEISRQTYDQAEQTALAAKATVAAQNAAVLEARHNAGAAEAAMQQAQTKLPQADASIQSALTRPQLVSQSQSRLKSAAAKVAELQAQLDQAKLNLSYTIIVAPVSGVVGKKTAEIGQNVSPGEQLMAVVPLDDIWVTANFKETQLRKMQPGQKVKFSVDAYDHEYSGHVTGIGGASGSRYSLLPPENATGNYVKVVQRIPVRIDLDPNENKDHRLRPGMSVDPKVYTKP
ncbi:MAG: HlyD family secretion protein [Bryobacteraceae bacterium]